MKSTKLRILSIFPGLLLCLTATFSQENPNGYRVKIPEFTKSPKIDGILENPFWENGAVLYSFTQYEPQEGIPPSEKTTVYIGYNTLPQNEMIISIRPSFEYRRIYDFNKALTDEDYQLSLFVNGWRQSHFWTTVSQELERYEGINFHKKSVRVNFSSEPFSWLNGSISYSFGDSIYYDEDPPYLGNKNTIGARLTLKPLTNLRLFYDFKKDRFFSEKGGDKVYEVNIISQRINYQLIRALSLRLITDYNDYYKELYTSFLFSYEYRPGTVFNIGVDDNQERNDFGIWQREDRCYFIKF